MCCRRQNIVSRRTLASYCPNYAADFNEIYFYSDTAVVITVATAIFVLQVYNVINKLISSYLCAITGRTRLDSKYRYA